MMKKIIVIVLLLSLICVFVGCSAAKIKNDTFYVEYAYSDEARDFVPTGSKIKFIKDFSGYEFDLGNGVSVMGTTTQNMNGYQLNVSKDVLTSLSGLDDLVDSDPEAYKELVDQIGKTITANEQIHFYQKYMFSHTSIVMMKSIANDGDYANIDGTYEYRPLSSQKYRFKNGLVYKITVKTDKGVTTETEDEYPSLRYTIQDGIISLIRIDEDGLDVYIENKLQVISYLFATITYPKDFAENFDPDDTQNYLDATRLAGKTMAVLTNKFYCA